MKKVTGWVVVGLMLSWTTLGWAVESRDAKPTVESSWEEIFQYGGAKYLGASVIGFQNVFVSP